MSGQAPAANGLDPRDWPCGETLVPRAPKGMPLSGDAARDILHRYLRETAARVAFGMRSSRAMHRSVAACVAPEGGRVNFILAVTEALEETMLQSGRAFDQTFPYDMALLQDYLDVLETVKQRFLARAGVCEGDG